MSNDEQTLYVRLFFPYGWLSIAELYGRWGLCKSSNFFWQKQVAGNGKEMEVSWRKLLFYFGGAEGEIVPHKHQASTLPLICTPALWKATVHGMVVGAGVGQADGGLVGTRSPGQHSCGQRLLPRAQAGAGHSDQWMSGQPGVHSGSSSGWQ